MQEDLVPQDNSRTYGGHKKLLYAVNPDGDYTTINSSGWEVEELATVMAIEELERQTEEAKQRVLAGKTAPLEYYMFLQRMDLTTLSQTTGLFQWRIKRHLKPKNFSKLKESIWLKYEDALGLDRSVLSSLPGGGQ